ncbi:GMP synthase [Streptococcus pseudopneumoniae G42]|nr:GMP synthase [Streptococcus pseudopneumoniae G42]
MKELLIYDIIKRKGLHKKVGRMKMKRRQNRNQGGLAFSFYEGLGKLF